jgi:hypothetical protein
MRSLDQILQLIRASTRLRRMDAVRMLLYDRQVMDMLSALPL